MYAEDYVDPVKPGFEPEFEFTVDIRYITNIDPKLASSTLLDPASANKLDEAYMMIYQQACSMRLCRWAPDLGYYVSLFGPKVDDKPKNRTILGNRPTVSTKSVDSLLATGESSPAVRNQDQQTTSHVENWIEEVDVEPMAGTAHLILDAQVADPHPVMGTDEDLIDFDDNPISYHAIPPKTSSGTTTEKLNKTPTTEKQASSLCHKSATLRPEVGTSRAGSVSKARCELAFTGDDSLIDMLAAIEIASPDDALGSSINWAMPPLIPSSTGDGNSIGSTEQLPVAAHGGIQNRSPTPSLQTRKRRSEQAKAGENNLDATRTPREKKATLQAEKPSQPLSLSSRISNSDPLLATESFVTEIEAAITRFLTMGPYRRRNVAVRAELGRTILEVVAPSGLAYNAANTPSNGWAKPILVKQLNRDYGRNEGISFTKVLSTYAYDLEDMINMKADGARLWEEKPSRAWTTYSFRCALRSAENLCRFIVDVEDDGASSDGFSCSIRAHSDAPRAHQQLPIYVHAICRHWDLRIMESHADTDEFGERYHSFATMLMDSLSITYVTAQSLAPHF